MRVYSFDTNIYERFGNKVMINRTEIKYVRDLFKVFAFLNQYSWAIARDEVIFLLIVDLFETVRGIRAREITKILMRGDYITQSDKNRTWQAGKQLIKKGFLTSPKVGYYISTAHGRERSRKILRELRLQDSEFDLSD